MGDKDKAAGSETPRESEGAVSGSARGAPPRGYPPADGSDDRTIFQPMPVRRMPLRRAAGPSADATTQTSPSPGAPRRARQEATEVSVANNNPLIRAAGPLLLLLGRLRTSLVRASVPTLVPQIIQSIERVDTKLLAEGVSVATAERVKYCLCVTADEVLTNLPGSEDRVAAEGGIARQFFGDSARSDRFLAAVKAAESEDPELLEFQHACLSLAFVGNSRLLGVNAATLQTSRRDLLERMKKLGASRHKALSPHWQGLALPAPGVRLQIPFWAITGIVGMALFALYLMLRTVLGLQAESVAQTMRQLAPPISITARNDILPPAPLPPTPTQASQLARIRTALAANIAAETLSVEATPNQVFIRIPTRMIFPPERATIRDDFRLIALHIATALDGERGPIKVIGHTDDTPIINSRYTSNFALSLDQAKSVAALIRRSLTQPDRIDAEGKGAEAPLEDNNTPEGRAMNRRIEIVIPRSD
ncbi:MAG: type IVB secretion system protein IcmH/DotU [Beijerinckiaceae bacterium]